MLLEGQADGLPVAVGVEYCDLTDDKDCQDTTLTQAHTHSTHINHSLTPSLRRVHKKEAVLQQGLSPALVMVSAVL